MNYYYSYNFWYISFSLSVNYMKQNFGCKLSCYGSKNDIYKTNYKWYWFNLNI